MDKNHEFQKAMEEQSKQHAIAEDANMKSANNIEQFLNKVDKVMENEKIKFLPTEKGFTNPREIKIVVPKSTYVIPCFKITNDGIKDSLPTTLFFCKGNKADETIFRQDGIFTETLIQVCIEYLKENNVGDLENEHTTNAIAHLETALYKLDQRVKDRINRGVQQTYNK